MVNESFCVPCQTILAARTVRDGEQFRHHLDGESFRQALDMGCQICLQLLTFLGRPADLQQTRWHVSLFEPASPRITIHHGRSGDSSKNIDLFLLQKTDSISLSSNTGSDQSFNFLIDKYSECKSTHSKCAGTSPEQYFPSRILNVGTCGQNDIHLVDREHALPIAPYATLSHCWGGPQPLKLEATTESVLRTGVAVHQLSKTFQHAVHVARRLDIRWLWIDALCIFQDDLENGSIPASAMQDTYQYAALNIAATSGRDGSCGLFKHRNLSSLMPIDVEVSWYAEDPLIPFPRLMTCVHYEPVEEAIDNATLNSRAWVMQERQLSSRIVHYTSEIVCWECHELFANEKFPKGLPSREHYGRQKDTLKRLLEARQESSQVESHRELLYKTWGEFLDLYTRCLLTYQEDRLVAIAGIAHRVSPLLEDELVAGLWRNRFVEQLCWYALRPETKRATGSNEPWVAPSWSWAGCGYASVPNDTRWLHERDPLVKLLDLSVDTKPSGALISGSMKLQCRLIPAKLQLKWLGGWQEARLAFRDVETADLQSTTTLTFADLKLDEPCLGETYPGLVNVQVLPLLQGIQHEPWDFKMKGIAVVPSAEEQSAYERIGYFSCSCGGDMGSDFEGMWVDPGEELVKRYGQAKDQIIKIV